MIKIQDIVQISAAFSDFTFLVTGLSNNSRFRMEIVTFLGFCSFNLDSLVKSRNRSHGTCDFDQISREESRNVVIRECPSDFLRGNQP